MRRLIEERVRRSSLCKREVNIVVSGRRKASLRRGLTESANKNGGPRPPFLDACSDARLYSSGTSSSATMLMILISGLIAGPAVSL